MPVKQEGLNQLPLTISCLEVHLISIIWYSVNRTHLLSLSPTEFTLHLRYKC
jgi:hypothetical protein